MFSPLGLHPSWYMSPSPPSHFTSSLLVHVSYLLFLSFIYIQCCGSWGKFSHNIFPQFCLTFWQTFGNISPLSWAISLPNQKISSEITYTMLSGIFIEIEIVNILKLFFLPKFRMLWLNFGKVQSIGSKFSQNFPWNIVKIFGAATLFIYELSNRHNAFNSLNNFRWEKKRENNEKIISRMIIPPLQRAVKLNTKPFEHRLKHLKQRTSLNT